MIRRWGWVSVHRLAAAFAELADYKLLVERLVESESRRASDAIADYNRAVAERNEIEDAWHGRYDGLLVRYDALLEKYHALRVAGHQAKEPAPPVQPIADEFPSVIETAIMLGARGNRVLDRHLRDRARLRVARGERPEDIARVIQEGAGEE